MLTRRRFAAALLVASLDARRAGAQSDFGAGRPEERYFTVEARVDNARRGPVAEGYVYNRHEVHAVRVRLGVTPIDATGRPLPAVTAWVGDVPPRSRAFFTAPLPAGVSGVTASVTSFDWAPRGGGGM